MRTPVRLFALLGLCAPALAARADELDDDLHRYVAQMGSRNAMVALDAVDYIPYFGARAVPALCDGLRDPQKVIDGEIDRLKRLIDAEAARQKDETVRQRFLDVKRDGLPKFRAANVRAFAAVALARVPDVRAVEPLIAALDDDGTYELNVLSDDGAEVFPCYDSPQPGAVRRHAVMALETVTGQSFGYIDPEKPETVAKVRDAWKKWWQDNRETFRVQGSGAGGATGPKPTEAGTPSPPPGGDPLARAPLSATQPDAVRFPIPDHARYLRGVKICIDPGHGGDRWKRGYKRGPSGASEAEANLRVARFLRDFLAAAGAVVVMTRDSDADIPLMERPVIANKAQADLFVSVHHNWAPRYTAESTTTWYHAAPDYGPSGMDLGRYIQNAVAEATGLPDLHRAGGLMTDYMMFEGAGFGVLRALDRSVTGVLCETTYYSNHEVERKMRSIEFNKREAHGYFLGFAQYMYMGVPRVELAEPDPARPQAGPVTTLTLRIHDGLAERREWGWDRIKVFAESIQVRVDDKPVAHEYDAATGLATVKLPAPLPAGEHAVVVRVMNLNKNHSWPKPVKLTIP